MSEESDQQPKVFEFTFSVLLYGSVPTFNLPSVTQGSIAEAR